MFVLVHCSFPNLHDLSLRLTSSHFLRFVTCPAEEFLSTYIQGWQEMLPLKNIIVDIWGALLQPDRQYYYFTYVLVAGVTCLSSR